jgi:RNA polymerase sigma-70 factor (ECF subfamily)
MRESARLPPRAPLPARSEAAQDERDVVNDLVRRSVAGDDAAFSEIFKRFKDKVYRIAWRFTHDHDEAMDLVQTVFIKVHRSLDSYREESSFATWIARVTTNCGIDHVRSRKREGRVDLDEAVETEAAAGAEGFTGSPQRGPGAAVLDKELARALHEAVGELSEKHRSVFVLHCVEGMPYQGIADTLQISIGTVMSRLFHARRYLRKSLAPYLGEARVRSLLRGQEAEIQAAMGGRGENE